MATNSYNKSEKYNLKDSVTYADGSIVSKIIEKNNAGNITLFAFDENQNLSEHTAPFDAIIQIIEGKAKVIIDGKVNEMTEGDFIIMPANIPHAVEAETKFKMILTMLKN
ncbi:MAG: cupin domain-containing protein [Bacteroidales bacterium]